MDDTRTPAIEGVVREAIQDDTSVAVDSVLLDANAATAVRPAGILNGVAALTATAGGGIAGIVGDIKQLVNAITVATYGNVRNLGLVDEPAATCFPPRSSARPALACSRSRRKLRGARFGNRADHRLRHGASEDGDPDGRSGLRFRWRRCTTLRNQRQRYAASRRYDSGGIGCRRHRPASLQRRSVRCSRRTASPSGWSCRLTGQTVAPAPSRGLQTSTW